MKKNPSLGYLFLEIGFRIIVCEDFEWLWHLDFFFLCHASGHIKQLKTNKKLWYMNINGELKI